MNIMGNLPETTNANQLVIIMTDRYLGVTRAIPARNKTSSHATLPSINSWTMLYGILKLLLMESRPQFMCKYFNEICRLLGVKQRTITTYHPQRNGQKEGYIKTIVARLHKYGNKDQSDCGLFVQPLTYAYSRQVHQSTEMTPFISSLIPEPPSTDL